MAAFAARTMTAVTSTSAVVEPGAALAAIPPAMFDPATSAQRRTSPGNDTWRPVSFWRNSKLYPLKRTHGTDSMPYVYVSDI